jgi:methylthioribose-1-phosphate isomerase
MQTIFWEAGAPVILDQTRLPMREVYLRIDTVEAMAEAIERLRVRGAPLIGVAAAYGLALSARRNLGAGDFLSALRADFERLRRTRPTAVNLFWALERAMGEIERAFSRGGAEGAADAALSLAERMKEEDVRINRRMGDFGQVLIADGDGILTHCNAGALATAGHGTALGVIRSAVERGKRVHVYADETRPLLQGARLTAWELRRDGIPVTVQSDGMAAVLMAGGKIQRVIVGADRIARNGDTANKVGTYAVAVLAKAHGIPFYVAAPRSTIDGAIETGASIPIEMRDPDEMRFFQGVPSAPEGVDAFNPAFDVTPARLIGGIITEAGVLAPPYEASIAAAITGS